MKYYKVKKGKVIGVFDNQVEVLSDEKLIESSKEIPLKFAYILNGDIEDNRKYIRRE